MNATKLLVAALGAVVLIGGVSAVGAAAPADAGDATGHVNAGETATADASADADEVADGDDQPGAIRPAGGLPEQVPDRVSEIHAAIEVFGDGAIDNLGNALSGLLSGDGDGNQAGDGGPDTDGPALADRAA